MVSLIYKCVKKLEWFIEQVSSEVWLEATDRQRSAGKFTKWIVDGLKPCLEYQLKKLTAISSCLFYSIDGQLERKSKYP